MGVITGRGGAGGTDMGLLLATIAGNLLELAAALDADDGVTLETYVSTLEPILSPDSFAGIAGAQGFRDQGVLLQCLDAARLGLNGLNALLDSDTAITDTNYAALCNMADWTNVPTVASLGDVGMYEGSLIMWFSTFLTKYNAMLAKLDADLADTAYVTSYGITAANYIDTTGCKAIVG
jgi:hypothetical protein